MGLHNISGNTLSIFGLVLLVVPLIAWLIIFNRQYQLSRAKTYRINVLIARTALFLPVYAIFMFIALEEPVTFEGLQIPFAIVEGYSFYCVVALVVANLGGPKGTLNSMEVAPRGAYCSCYPREPQNFYTKVVNAQWYMFFVRTVLIFVATIAAYTDHRGLYLIGTLVGFGILVYALLSIVNFYEHLMFLNLGHVFKILTLKVSIGIIVIQGIIEQILVMSGTLDNVKATPNYTQDGTITRYYALIVLMEYVLFSVAVCWVYTQDVQYLNFTSPEDDSSSSDNEFSLPSTISNGRAGGDSLKPKEDMSKFAFDVFAMTDIWGRHSLALRTGEGSSLHESVLGGL